MVLFKVIYSQGSSLQNETLFHLCKYRTMEFYAPQYSWWLFFSLQKPGKCIGVVKWGIYYQLKAVFRTEDLPCRGDWAPGKCS